MQITIHAVGEDRLEQLRQLSLETFRATFANSNSAEDMAHYEAEAFSLERLSAELSTGGSRFYLALDDERQALGYLKLNTGSAQSEAEAPEALEIERIYTLPKTHGSGLGQQLLDYALSLAQQEGRPYIWLGVWEHNARALRFYRRNGFEVYGAHDFVLGSDRQRDLLMKRKL